MFNILRKLQKEITSVFLNAGITALKTVKTGFKSKSKQQKKKRKNTQEIDARSKLDFEGADEMIALIENGGPGFNKDCVSMWHISEQLEILYPNLNLLWSQKVQILAALGLLQNSYVTIARCLYIKVWTKKNWTDNEVSKSLFPSKKWARYDPK